MKKYCRYFFLLITVSSICLLTSGNNTPDTAKYLGNGWWNQDWKYRQWVSIDPGGLRENIVDFPLFLRLTDNDFARTFARTDGKDIRAVDVDGRLLPIQLVRSSVNDVRLYVSVTLPKQSLQSGFYLYYGNSNPSVEAPAIIWPRSYLANLPLAGSSDNFAADLVRINKKGYVVQNGWTAGLITGNSHPWVTFDREYSGFLEILPGENKPAQLTMTARIRTGFNNRTMTLFSAGNLNLIIDSGKLVLGAGRKQLIFSDFTINQWQSIGFSYDVASGRARMSLSGKIKEGLLDPFALDTDTIRIGRHRNNLASSQFGGDIDDLRILSDFPSNEWTRITGRNVQNDGLIHIDNPEGKGNIAVLPPPFPIRPADGAQSYKSSGIQLEWLPVVGASHYEIALYTGQDRKQPTKVLQAGKELSYQLTQSVAEYSPVYWSVRAVSASGIVSESQGAALEFRRFDNKLPPLSPVKPAGTHTHSYSIKLNGYLKGRLDSLERYMIDFPKRNPGLLRMLRERPENNIPEWAGVFPGQYLSSAQLVWRVTKSEKLRDHIKQYVNDLISTQRADGYMGPFEGLNRSLSLWNHYATVVGLITYYEDTRNAAALKAACKIMDLIITEFGPDGKTIPKTGGASEAISHAAALVFRETGKPAYGQFVSYLVHEAWNESGGVAYYKLGQDEKSVADFPVRRWEGVHNIQALAEMYWLTGNKTYQKAYEHLWSTLLKTERHNTGGFSTNEGLLETPYHRGTIETCCTVAWVLLSTDMLRLTGDSRVADELEWSTLNSALGSIPLGGGCSTYATQEEGYRQFCVLKQGPWDGPELNCCSSNAPRAIGNIANWALLQNDEGLLLNYYGPSEQLVELPKGNKLKIVQVTNYPAENTIQMNIALSKSATFTLQLRIPQWSANTQIKVNGQLMPAPKPGSYYPINREWETGDNIQLELDFTPRIRVGEEDFEGKVSIYQGPILLTQDLRFSEDQLPAFVNAKSISTTPVINYKGENAPWVLSKIKDGDNKEWLFCDFSSAGQMGHYYRTWISAKNTPPSPFYQLAVDTTGKNLRWEKTPGAKNWTILISDSEDFDNPKKISNLTTSTYSIADWKPGTYWWTVIAENESGSILAENYLQKIIIK